MSLTLSFQEIEELLERIVHNACLTKIDSGEEPRFVVFSYPSAQYILKSRAIRLQALHRAEKEGLPSREEIDKIIETRNIINPIDRSRIKELKEKIVAQHRVLQLTKLEGRRKPILENIERFEKELVAINSKADEFRSMSREHKADEEALLYLAWAGTYNTEGVRWWSTFEEFEKETNNEFRQRVFVEFLIFNNGLPTEKIRYLARHPCWRIKYTASLKMGGPVFVRGLEDLTPDQQALLFWSSHYQSIYDMLPDDKPDDETINDDEALDKYMEKYFKHVESERKERRLGRNFKGKGRLSASEKEEVIITQAHPEYMKMAYSEQRIKASDGTAEVEVISPNSRRARNRRAARRR